MTTKDRLPRIAVGRPALSGSDGAGEWDEAVLQGKVGVPEEAVREKPVVVLVVVDDDSGSMSVSTRLEDGGYLSRVQAVREKTFMLLHQARECGVRYSYARFTSRVQMMGNVTPEAAVESLRATGGTALQSLAQAALECAEDAVGRAYREDAMARANGVQVIFALNTDGEASDGVAAAACFREGFARMCGKYSITACRSFVLGIGGRHDHKVLGAISVGVSTYINCPDEDLSRLSTDILSQVLPELGGVQSSVKVTVLSSGEPSEREEEVVADTSGEINISDVSVRAGDHTFILGSNIVFLQWTLLERGSPEYWEALEGIVRRNAVALGKGAQLAVRGGRDEKRAKELGEDLAKLQALVCAMPEGSVVGRLRRELRQAVGSGQKEAAVKITAKIRSLQAAQKGGEDQAGGVRAAVDACAAAVEALRLGRTLHEELERDMMEFLSAGGFQRWGERKKRKLAGRQLSKANSQSVSVADARVIDMVNKCGDAMREEEEEEGVSCWITLCGPRQLATLGDVMCIAGYVPPGARRMALAGVNSSSVLQEAVLKGRVRVCLSPLSFLTLRELLQGGNQIARAPDGGAVNTPLCALPATDSELSLGIARAYQPLITSFFLTSRSCYTEKAGEFRNGLLVGLQAAVVAGSGAAQRNCVVKVCTGLRAMFGEAWTRQCRERYEGVRDRMLLTSHEVPSVLLAGADALLLGEVPPSHWYRTVVFRIFRDAVARRRRLDCETTLELALQGLNTKAEAAEGVCGGFADVIAAGMASVFGGSGGGDVDMAELCGSMAGLALENFQEEAEMDDAAGGAAEEQDEDDSESGDEDHGKLRRGQEKKRTRGLVRTVRVLTQERKGCPGRGGPTGDLSHHSAEEVGPVQRLVVLAMAADCEKELQWMRMCAAHLKGCKDPPSLAELLGAPDEKSLLQILQAAAILALRLKENARYRTEAEKEDRGLLGMPAEGALEVIDGGVRTRNEAAWARNAASEKEMKMRAVSLHYRRTLLRMRQTPETWGCFIPLRISSRAHLAKLNKWTRKYRKFAVEPAETPDGQWTGMAINTVLNRGSPWFMRHANAKEAICMTWGGRGMKSRTGVVTEELAECQADAGAFAIVAALNLHVAARSVFTAAGARPTWADFRAGMAVHCPSFTLAMLPRIDALFVELWVSYSLGKDECRRDPAHEAFLVDQVPPGELREVVRTVVKPLTEWYEDPVYFLSNKEYMISGPGFTEFLSAVGPSDEEELLVAKTAFEKPAEDLSARCKVMKRKRDD